MPLGMSDELIFASENGDDTPAIAETASVAWKILIVDDDHDVHAVTRMALEDVVFHGCPVTFLSAYSGTEALQLMSQHPDVAVVLLDVVMETDDAGLQVVRAIREDLGNAHTRIILRTGQPGQAPEREIILNYDINDYKSKTELTAQRLFTTFIAALRSYVDITALEHSRNGLEKILCASTRLFERRALAQFIEGALFELKALIGDAQSIVLCKVLAKAGGTRLDFRAMGADGDLTVESGAAIDHVLPHDICADIESAYRTQSNLYRDQHCIIVFKSRYHMGTVIYMRGHAPLSESSRRLLEVFCSTLAIGFDNAALYEQSSNAQKATVFALANLAEFKDEDTGDHVRRIERLTTLIADELRLRRKFPDDVDEVFVRQIGLASILHDVGKVAIPDAILRKPGKLTPEEWLVMKTHAGRGGQILAKAAQLVEGSTYLSMAAEIAACHHEKYGGGGYPLGLRRDEIPLSARITAVADVYDALCSRRPYKEAWAVDQALAAIRTESGAHFDPDVVEALEAVVFQLGMAAGGGANSP